LGLNAGLHGGSRANLYKSLARLQGETDFGDGTAHITLQTSKEDFDKAVGELKKSGVKVLIDKPVERPTGRGLYFFDTEGNYLQLHSIE
jgi:predicted enzyme related to lactoylglutathione lyase